MDPHRVDRISKLFAQRRFARREAIRGNVAGAMAQEATPGATPPAGAGGEKAGFLFVQSFESGSIAPKAGAEGTFTLTLEHGLGQTIYFSDRPERIVGATPTAQVQQALGFTPDNPPNAAILVENGTGSTNIAVVQLTSATYDEASRTATYDATPLADFSRTEAMGFHDEPADLSSVPTSFGAAHLLIDDCPDAFIDCYSKPDYEQADYLGRIRASPTPMCYQGAVCQPCEPFGHNPPYYCATHDVWVNACDKTYPKKCKLGKCGVGWGAIVMPVGC